MEISTYEKDTRAMLEKVEKRLNGNLERMWTKLDHIEEKVNRRVPPWVLAIISLLTGILGVTLSKLL